MVFPPTSEPDRANLNLTGPIRLDEQAVESLYQAIWFLHPNTEVAASVTRWTFEVATTRRAELPRHELMQAWLVAIADRELRRVEAVRRRTGVSLDPADTSDRHDLAHRLADALRPLDQRQRAALVLRYRLGQTPSAVSAALGLGVAETERLLRRAARRAAKNAATPISSLAVADPPTPVELPAEVTPLDQQRGRHRLDYGWHTNSFPTGTSYDHSTRRWALVAVAAALIVAGMVGLNNRPDDNRPHLVDEPESTTTRVPESDDSSAPLPRISADEPLT